MKRKPTILVVDDSENVAKTLGMLLESWGYAAIPAFSAEQALEVVSGIAVDIAILDVNLPRKDGIKTAIEISRKVPSCKIQLISGDSSSTEILERAQKDGINFPVLAKPIPPDELMSAIRSLLKS